MSDTSYLDQVVAKLQLETLEARQKIQNEVSDAALRARMIETLPSVVEKMPKPNALTSVSVALEGACSVSATSASFDAVGVRRPKLPRR